jgi:hypothetical protein
MLCRGVRRGELWRKGYRRPMAGIERGSDESGTQPLVRVLSRRQCHRMFGRFAEPVSPLITPTATTSGAWAIAPSEHPLRNLVRNGIGVDITIVGGHAVRERV